MSNTSTKGGSTEAGSTQTAWHAKIGIGVLTSVIGFGSFAIWFFARRKYRLIFRDEITVLGAPLVLFCVGMMVSAIMLWLLWGLAAFQKRKVGWYWEDSGRSLRRGGPVRWEDVLMAVVPGAALGAIGTALWLNCAFDNSPQRTDVSTIIAMHRKGSGGARGGPPSYHFRVCDWNKRGSHVTFSLLTSGRAFYYSHKPRDTLRITTRKGTLGLEWIVRVR